MADGHERRKYVSPLREEQARATRDRIVDALTTLLEDRRADEATTKEVARTAGVSESTVYRHFPDRTALVEAVAARLGDIGPGPGVPHRLDDLATAAIELMGALETQAVAARAEALLNTDPRWYSEATRANTRRFTELVDASLPEADAGQRLAVAAVLRVLLSAQTWLRLREEFGLHGEESGPIVAWAVESLLTRVRESDLPPVRTAPAAQTLDSRPESVD
jgi:AcrR family transcriptional regulator